jgi:hypothetical protein
MKKLQIELSDDAHSEILREQLERKIKKNPRTTVVEIASDLLNEMLEAKSKKREALK